MGPGRPKRQRRSFSDEFKAEVVKKILSSGKTAGQVARELDLTETAVRHWLKQSQVDRGKGPLGALTTAEKEELAQLRKEVRELREDREILKKAAALKDPHEFMSRAPGGPGTLPRNPSRPRARAATRASRAW
jgi:transposase